MLRWTEEFHAQILNCNLSLSLRFLLHFTETRRKFSICLLIECIWIPFLLLFASYRAFPERRRNFSNLSSPNNCRRLVALERFDSLSQKLNIIEGCDDLFLFLFKKEQRFIGCTNSNGSRRSENKLGQGGFGSVYKGRLRDGTLAAIKVLSVDSSQGTREFLSEINVITVINHDNLVKLHGCCVEGKHRILVYPFLENNSLDRTLLGRRHGNIQFNWQTRCKICIGIARGLAFLHEEVQPHVIHRDIKASNILLDKDLSPKISDFGLARLLPAHLTHISTRIAGTAGYLAPEYAIRGQATRRTDIYSFGVLLLEIVCGRYNINRRLSAEEPYLLEMVWDHHEKGQLLEMIDISLNGDFEAEACRYLKVGLLCTQDMPKLRPSMSTVVKMLTGDIDISDQTISRPGMLSEFMLRKDVLGKKGESDSKLASTTEDSGKPIDSTTSSGFMDTSYGTITFNSIYDRSN